jgi:hypothetical protein
MTAMMKATPTLMGGPYLAAGPARQRVARGGPAALATGAIVRDR